MKSRDAQIQEVSLVPIGEAARILGVSVDTVRRWEREGRIASTRTLGNQRRFRLAELHELVGAA